MADQPASAPHPHSDSADQRIRSTSSQDDPDDASDVVDDVAQSYEDPNEVVAWHYSDPQRLKDVEGSVVENNVVDWVLQRAKVVDKPIAFDELMRKEQ